MKWLEVNCQNWQLKRKNKKKENENINYMLKELKINLNQKEEYVMKKEK